MGRVLDLHRAARAGSPWAARADGAERLAHRGAYRRRRASRSCCWSRTARSGTGSRSGGALQALGRARDLGGAGGFYALQAAIIACHAQARDGQRYRLGAHSRDLYGELAALVRSPVIELNRAVAVGMAEGPEAGLAIVDNLVNEPALEDLSSARKRARRSSCTSSAVLREARAAFVAAAELAGNAREQDLLEAARGGSRRGGDVVVLKHYSTGPIAMTIPSDVTPLICSANGLDQAPGARFSAIPAVAPPCTADRACITSVLDDIDPCVIREGYLIDARPFDGRKTGRCRRTTDLIWASSQVVSSNAAWLAG